MKFGILLLALICFFLIDMLEGAPPKPLTKGKEKSSGMAIADEEEETVIKKQPSFEKRKKSGAEVKLAAAGGVQKKKSKSAKIGKPNVVIDKSDDDKVEGKQQKSGVEKVGKAGGDKISCCGSGSAPNCKDCGCYYSCKSGCCTDKNCACNPEK